MVTLSSQLLLCCGTYRRRVWYIIVDLDTEISTSGHYWARLRAAGWAAEAGGAESMRVCWCSHRDDGV